MIDDRKIFEDWELEKLKEYVKYKSEKDLKERALKEGLEQGKELGMAEGMKILDDTIVEQIKIMLGENMDMELISKISNKSIDEINKIKKLLDNK